MEIQAFGYLGIGSSSLDDWAAFATTNIGMQSVDRAKSMRAFRMDDRKQRLFIDRTIELGTQVFGWEVANAAALDFARRPPRSGRCRRETRTHRTGRPTVRDKPNLLRRPCRQPPGSLSLCRYRRCRLPARPRRFRVPYRPTGYGAHPSNVPRYRRRSGLLQRPARLSHQRLHDCPVEGLFPSRQRSPPQRRSRRSARAQHASPAR